MHLLERDTFLDALEEYADEAAAGASRVVFLAGEAGVGKTSVVEELVGRLPDARCLIGACDGAFTPFPLGPLFDIAPLLGGELATACNAAAPRDRLFRALLDELTRARALTVFIIEDAHWADEATLDLIRFLGRRLRDCPAMLIVTYRDEGLSAVHPLRVTLGDLAAERALRRIALPPLSAQAVGRLAQASNVDPDELYLLTGGNPFFVTEVLGGGDASLPISVRDAVLARVARLSPAARTLLDAVAVIGAFAQPAVVDSVAGGVDGVEECLAAGALQTEPGGMRFRHELARLAVLDVLPAHRRRELHARALAALEEQGEDVAVLAHHAEHALATGAVLRYAPLAGRRASELSAHREAALQYSRALQFAHGLGDGERAALHDALAEELALIEEWQAAIDERRVAVRLWKQAGDTDRYGASLCRLTRALLRQFSAEGWALVEESIAVLEAQPASPSLAWAYANKSAALMTEDAEQAIVLAQRAREILTGMGIDDPALVSDALNSEACAMFHEGRDGTALLQRALDVALSGGAETEASRAYANLAAIHVSAYAYDRALAVVDEGIAFCDDRDLTAYANCLRGSRIAALARLGAWEELVELCARELGKPSLSPFNLFSPLLDLAAVLGRRGDPEAYATWAKAADLVREAVFGEYDDALAIVEIELAWLRGDRDAALTRARSKATSSTLAGEAEGALAVWLRRLGVVDVRTPKDPIRARQLSDPWREVAAMWEGLGAPYEQALACFDSGEEEGLRESLTLLDGLGAKAAAGVVRAEMRRRGLRAIPRGPRSQTRSDRFGLTPRQREVLELLSAGLTNAAMGERLFLSERTVDHHVSAVLAKLGVETRYDAARLAVNDLARSAG